MVSRIKDYYFRFVRKYYFWLSRKNRFSGQYTFIDRKKNYDNLLIIVAGFQSYYWDTITKRVQENILEFDAGIDICVCVPHGIARDLEKIREICQNNGWSYIETKSNKLGLAQNIAVKLHDRAKWIFKIDEDIILPHNYFRDMFDIYDKAESSSPMRIGILAPSININTSGTKIFLETMDLQDSFQERFGKYQYGPAFDDNQILFSPEMALWIWERSIPFDNVSGIIASKNKGIFSYCPHRFSIGAILFSRNFWDEIGGFYVGADAELGGEELQICEYCSSNFQAIVIANGIFVGHLGFYHQKKVCKEFFLQEWT